MQPYEPSEMADLDLSSLDEAAVPSGHKSGFVAVVGRPNVGKSTLMNALLGQKLAIVTPRPQTTRANQLGILTAADHQIIFVDTPGLIQPRHQLDERMRQAAEEALADADVELWLVDAGEPPGPADEAIAASLAGLPAGADCILGINKADLLRPEEVVARADAYRALLPPAEWLLFSALTGAGLDALLALILAALPEGPRYYPADQTTDVYLRDIAAELIREQIFLQMRDELPYGAFVQVEEFKSRDNGVIYIAATVYVERESHKKIIIGARGRQLRQIGAAARKQIEQLVEAPVYLELWVKIEPDWRRSEEALIRFGYGP
ncbi:MAG: GTPase Era [Candidatus Promineifilaceae bacterium]